MMWMPVLSCTRACDGMSQGACLAAWRNQTSPPAALAGGTKGYRAEAPYLYGHEYLMNMIPWPAVTHGTGIFIAPESHSRPSFSACNFNM
jgi:hypothetical protein